MDQLKEFERINKLLAVYGDLLTETQKRIMDYYYGYNLSLMEISEELKISRTAVLDAIKKSSAKLEHYEQVIRVIDSNEKYLSLIKNIKNDPTKENIEELERMIKDGI